MNEILIAGIGSPHGADCLGWAVIDRLRHSGLPDTVKLINCALPVELSLLLPGTSSAIVVDAMLGEGPPGAIHIFEAADLPQATTRLCTHGLGLIDSVRLAQALGFVSECLCVIALDVAVPDAVLEPAWVDKLCNAVMVRLSVQKLPTEFLP